MVTVRETRACDTRDAWWCSITRVCAARERLCVLQCCNVAGGVFGIVFATRMFIYAVFASVRFVDL